MNTEKIHNMTDVELKQQEHELQDQLFRLKFQMKMGQTDTLNKVRELRKSVARVKTIVRQRELGIEPVTAKHAASADKPAKSAAKAPAKKTKTKHVAKHKAKRVAKSKATATKKRSAKKAVKK